MQVPPTPSLLCISDCNLESPPPMCAGAEGVKLLEEKMLARWLKANQEIKGEKPAMKNLPAGVDWKMLVNKRSLKCKGLSERFQVTNP